MEEKSTPTEVKASEAKPKKGNKMILIIIIVVVALCVLCSGIGLVFQFVINKASDEVSDNLTEESINNAIENGVEKSIEDNTDKNSDVDFSLNGDAKLPDGFPSEVKMYDGAKISSSTRVKDDNGNYEYTVIATADASGEDVVDFFKSSLEKKGWEVTSESNIFGFSLSMEKDNQELIVVAFGDFTGGDGSTYTLTITEK